MSPSGDNAKSVEFLSTPRTVDFPENWYDLGHPDHFWFRWRYEAAIRQVRDLQLSPDRPLRALDVGCGAGILRDQLEAGTRWTVDICDLELRALARATPGRGRTLYYDIQDRQPDLREAYDIVIAYDVIEHISEAEEFLDAACWHLKPSGHLLVNVPALEALRSAYDDAAGHLRRYTQGSLRGHFSGLGELAVVDTRYWGLLLIPLAVARKVLFSLPGGRTHPDVITRGFRMPSDILNEGLTLIMRLELAALRRPPLGTSVLLAARRGRPVSCSVAAEAS